MRFILILNKVYKALIPARSGAQSFFWKYRHLLKSTWSPRQFTEANLSHPQWEKLLPYSSAMGTFGSLPYVECASGINMNLSSEKFPARSFAGIDDCPRSVTFAEKHFLPEGITNRVFKQSNFPAGFNDNKCWVRHYASVFGKYAEHIEKITVDPQSWQGNWGQYGKFIIIKLEKAV